MRQLFQSIIILLLSSWHAGAQSWDWARSASGCNSIFFYNQSITTDRFGNSYVSGIFQCPELRFPPFSISRIGSTEYNLYLVKYNNVGSVIWAKNYPYDANYVTSLSTDSSGTLFVTGGYRSDYTVGSFTLIDSLHSGDNGFFAKFDSSGEIINIKPAYNCPLIHGCTDVEGNFFLCGSAYSFPAVVSGSSISNSFLAKYDSNFNLIWIKITDVTIDKIAVDSNDVYIIGEFSGDIDYETTPLHCNGGTEELLIAKYSSAGSFLWVRQLNCSYTNTQQIRSFGIATDRHQNVYGVGTFNKDTVRCGTGFLLSPNNQESFFLVKFDKNGIPQWIRGGESACNGYSVAVDTFENIWISGYCDTPYFHLGSYSFGSSATCNVLSYLVAYSPSGTIGNINTFKCASGNVGSYIAANKLGELFISETFADSSFIIGNDTLFSQTGFCNVFMAKMSPGKALAVSKIASDEPQISIFPNPAKNELNIQLDNYDFRDADVSVYSLDGQVMAKGRITEKRSKISTASFRTGIYFVRLSINGNFIWKKILIEN